MSTKDTDSFLRAAKPTEGQSWVHVLCAVFSPEITFSDVVHLRLVEGISTIPRVRWSAVRPPPFQTPLMVTYTYHSGAPCVVRWVVLSFDAAIAFESTMFHALGGTVTGLVSSSNLRVFPFLHHCHAYTAVTPSRSAIIVVTPLRPRSKARRATWFPLSVVRNTTQASVCYSTCARRTKLAR